MSIAGAERRHTAVLGVLGGGQLGRMMALAGAPLGVRFRFLDPDPNAPAGEVGELINGGFDDPRALERFADGVDAITYEFENVPASTAVWLTSHRPGTVFPPPGALAAAQDRLEEKRAFERAGLEVPAYAPVGSVEELRSAIDGSIGLPCVLKTRRMGYDGKGQAVIGTETEVEPAFRAVSGHLIGNSGAGPGGPGVAAPELIVERFVPFDREVSIVCVRGADGSTAFYPITENTHAKGILRTSISPARNLPDGLESRAREKVERLLSDLSYRGVLALELFVVREPDGSARLLGNEMAPRVHNSGHWTMDGTATGQFENHVRAVLGWPLGSVAVVRDEGREAAAWGMINLIGGPIPDPGSMPGEPWMRLHLYGKAARPGRKIGHVNVVAPSREELLRRFERVRSWMPAARAE